MTRMPWEATATYQPLSIPAGLLLVVDVNGMNRIMLSRYITKLGYQATLVENGRQALDKLQGEPFDLVLLAAGGTSYGGGGSDQGQYLPIGKPVKSSKLPKALISSSFWAKRKRFATGLGLTRNFVV